jgi:hypothetical protein
MVKQHIILVTTICERLDSPPKEQVARWNLPAIWGFWASGPCDE